MHYCGVCYAPSEHHTEHCYVGEQDDGLHFHFPALCCPGCLCESFEEFHPIREPTEEEVRQYRLDAADPTNQELNRLEWMAHVGAEGLAA